MYFNIGGETDALPCGGEQGCPDDMVCTQPLSPANRIMCRCIRPDELDSLERVDSPE